MDPYALAMSRQIFPTEDFVDRASFKTDHTIDICSQQPVQLILRSTLRNSRAKKQIRDLKHQEGSLGDGIQKLCKKNKFC